MITAALICAGFVALLLVSERRESLLGRWLTKPAASLAFVAAGLASLDLSGPFGQRTMAALLLSGLGDVLLVRMDDERWFKAGTLAFALAHVAYAAAFVARGVAPFALEGALFVVAVTTALALGWLMPRVPSPLRPLVAGYAFIISSMVVTAIGTYAVRGNRWLLLGAFAFYGSDLAVARDRFVKASFANRAWGLPLYYAAQLLLATSS